MDLQTRISRLGGPAGSPRLYQAGIRAWLVALTGVLSALILLTILVAPARAQDRPDVENGQSPSGGDAVRVGEEVFAGDGCARAGDVAAGDCDEDSGKDKGKDEDATGGNTKTPEETSDRPQYGGGDTEPGEEPGAEEDTSDTTDTSGSGKPAEITGGTTVMATTGQGLDEPTGSETTRRALPGSEGTGSTAASEPASCPVVPPEDAPTATVARAVDGDTVELQEPVDGYDRVRLIGVDTPEMNGEDGPPEAGAEKATAFTAEALEGKEVALETDEEVEDPYGRLLAYVWIPGSDEANAKAENTRSEFFNRTLLTKGYAETMTVEPNDAYAECLAAAENEPQGKAPGTTGGTTRDGGGNEDENVGLLDRLRNLISSEKPSGGKTAANEDQYGQGGTTGGMTGETTGKPLPGETVSEEGSQGDTLQEDTALEPTTGGETYGKTDGAARDQTYQEDNPPPATGRTDGSIELREPDIQEPEAQEPKVQGPPARSGELGTGSELDDPASDNPTPDDLASDDPAPEEFAASQPPPPAVTDTELDPETDTGSAAGQTQLTTLPETSGAPLTQLTALPAGVLLICSGLFAAFVRGPQETRRNDSGG